MTKDLYTEVANSVLLVPGLGGSILKVRFLNNLKTELVWPRFLKANEYSIKYLSGRINPITMELENVDKVCYYFFKIYSYLS
jgi:hypothetical protein